MARILSKTSPKRPKKPLAAHRQSDSDSERVVVTEFLGSRGDAVASVGGENVYIADGLAGERLKVRLGARRGDGRVATLQEIITPAVERVAPPCRHFGTCGGCAVQHASPALMADWKRQQVVEALAHRGLGHVPVNGTRQIPPGTRRRAVFGYRQTVHGLIVGFNQRHSDQVVDIDHCLLLDPALDDVMGRLRDALNPFIPAAAAGDIMVTLSDSGPDVRVDWPAEPSLDTREGLSRLAATLGLARFALRLGAIDEVVVVHRPPVVHFGGVTVTLPMAAFLQPSLAGEAAILTLIEAGLQGINGPVIDLFAGLGTFSLPLAQHRPVIAWEGDGAAVSALRAAGVSKLTVHQRDLFRQPVLPEEWQGVAAIVLDPPRAGALSQAEVLARHPNAPARVIYVSCNPASFARDVRVLVDGGYALEAVTPLDQFPWSAHVEVVGVLSRATVTATAPLAKRVSLSPKRRSTLKVG